MQATFRYIDNFLIEHQNYWRLEPFFASQVEQLPWLSDAEPLCLWLSQLSIEQIESYKQDFSALCKAVEPFFPLLHPFLQQLTLPVCERNGLELQRGIDSGVPGRKLEQIVAMGEAALQHHQGNEWLEWCSGKGFLGRVLASQSRQKVTSFEYQHALCEAGQSEADRQSLPMTFVQGDAFSVEADEVFCAQQHAVALHACGDLHVTLIEKAVHHQLSALSISPCCYHLIHADAYQPLSDLGRQSKLKLSKAELRIPLQELVTGGERVRRHRMLEMSYRLAFDILLREEMGHTRYLPIPSIKKSQLADGFSAFCLWAAEQKSITLPHCDFDYYWQLGMDRFWRMERISLVQQLFKRGIEVWLALDKSIYLQKNGYEVTLSEFCQREMTPRNILLQARKI
ncbi:methyltransferase [Vibrio taketomensis]|uniref:methyltransferase n=1 Tax=Vibrio taketomensis TaxID=2572923 RepID=UPI0013899A88|nr:methyltransferase [Vibrio taketomensis]